MNRNMDAHANLLAKKIINSSLDAIITINSEGYVVGWNPAASRIFQHTESDVIGQSVSIIIPNSMRAAHTAGINAYNETGVSKMAGNVVELIGLRSDGTELPIEMSIFDLMNGEQRFFTAIIRDISERKRLEKSLRESEEVMRRLATLDALTGLDNRRSTMQKLEFEIRRSNQDESSLSIAILDIDFFKSINDTHGHGAGDDVLQQFSELLRLNVRQSDVCGRLGGEEFLIILPGCKDPHAFSLIDHLRNELEAHPLTTRVGEVSITCSIGIAQWNGEPMESFIGRADAALYQAKRNGRNQVISANN